MQALANDIICYNSMGLAANVAFPPGVISIGTATNPTLKLPAGNYYSGASGGFGTGTQFNATYNNHGALEFDENLTATCPDGNVHTASLTGGRYVGFGVHGCGQGGCINVPGDSTPTTMADRRRPASPSPIPPIRRNWSEPTIMALTASPSAAWRPSLDHS
jgi:hypothetical protein